MIHPSSLVTKRGSSFDYKSSHNVKGRASIVIGGECLEICSEVFVVQFSFHVPLSCDHFTYILLF